MKISIENKYLYVANKNGSQVAYFEHFEGKGQRKLVIAISTQDKQGQDLVKELHGKVFDFEVKWYGGKKFFYKGMFLQEKGAFHYLVLIKPNFLTNKSIK